MRRSLWVGLVGALLVSTCFVAPAHAALPKLNVLDASAAESTDRVKFEVKLSRASNKVVKVSYATVNGTAVAGSDFVKKSGGLRFDPGVKRKVVKVALVDDVLVEPAETFKLRIKDPVRAVLGDRTGKATIEDDDVAAPDEVVINEVMANPGAVLDSDGEYVEITNVGSTTVDLTGWRFGDDDSDECVLSGSIAVNDYLVIGRTSNASYLVPDLVCSTLVLTNSGETLVLRDGEFGVGTTIDAVAYETTTPGSSDQLDPDSKDAVLNDNRANWCLSTTTFGPTSDNGTPGSENAQCPAAPQGIVINEVMANPGAVLDSEGEYLELANIGSTTVDLTGWRFGDDDSDECTLSGSIAANDYLVIGRTSSELYLVPDLVCPTLVLTNTGETLVLRDGEFGVGATIDAVTYETTTPGSSDQLDPDSKDAVLNDSRANWCLSTTTFGPTSDNGTPGSENAQCSEL